MEDVICLAVPQTYEIVVNTKITAHPNGQGYPQDNFNYLIPIKKGGTLEYLYKVKKQFKCLPNDVYKYKYSLNNTEYSALIEYHEARKKSFGYKDKDNTEHTFYILGESFSIEQPFEKKWIQTSVKLNLNDIPLINKDKDIIKEIEEKLEELGIDGEEKRAYTKVRINQSVFREKLLHRYSNCCLCKVKHTSMLKASHIKPRAESSPNEKLDVDNGFLLCPNHDALFDGGLISFNNNGEILISTKLDKFDQILMNVDSNMKIKLTEGNKLYLDYHRKNIFK